MTELPVLMVVAYPLLLLLRGREKRDGNKADAVAEQLKEKDIDSEIVELRSTPGVPQLPDRATTVSCDSFAGHTFLLVREV